MLDVIDFGRQLVETEDLDPIYTMLWKAKLERKPLYKWLYAYWCFYDAGTSSWLTDQADYSKAFRTAAASSDYPRGTERRHFRGAAAIKSVESQSRYLARHGRGLGLAAIFDELGHGSWTLKQVMEYVQLWEGFGPWIAFKVADMLERLGLANIDFTGSEKLWFDSPQDGARLVLVRHGPRTGDGQPMYDPKTDFALGWSTGYVLQKLKGLKAPPRYERELNSQEAETIFCKWKSHLSGHYEVGKDTKEIRHGLLRFARWPTAQRLLKCL